MKLTTIHVGHIRPTLHGTLTPPTRKDALALAGKNLTPPKAATSRAPLRAISSPTGQPPSRRWSTASASRTLADLPESVRAPIASLYRSRGGTFAGAWDKPAMSLLAGAIFEAAENDTEHRAMASWPPIAKWRALADDLRARRNALYDLTGENEVRT